MNHTLVLARLVSKLAHVRIRLGALASEPLVGGHLLSRDLRVLGAHVVEFAPRLEKLRGAYVCAAGEELVARGGREREQSLHKGARVVGG